jgi:uncharacterized protein (TIGR00369 family)
MDLTLKLQAGEVENLIHAGFAAKNPFLKIDALEPGRARVRLLYRDSMLRPGNVLSGPALFTAADTAMYVLVLSHVGPQMMAVTSDLTMHFVSKALPGDILADVRLLKLGRRLVVMEVSLYSSAAPDRLVTHVTGSYALPT